MTDRPDLDALNEKLTLLRTLDIIAGHVFSDTNAVDDAPLVADLLAAMPALLAYIRTLEADLDAASRLIETASDELNAARRLREDLVLALAGERDTLRNGIAELATKVELSADWCLMCGQRLSDDSDTIAHTADCPMTRAWALVDGSNK